MGDAPRPEEGEKDQGQIVEEPIDRQDVERRRRKHADRAVSYAVASNFLGNLRGNHSQAVMALDIAARMSREFESELGVLLGEIPF
jgi:hypothetical protein